MARGYDHPASVDDACLLMWGLSIGSSGHWTGVMAIEGAEPATEWNNANHKAWNHHL